VDLFDTLVLRATAQPADVFLRAGALGVERGVLRPHVTRTQFQVLRQAAEDNARAARRAQTSSSEVTLLEIYDWMPPGVLASTGDAMAAIELDVERALLYPHPRTLRTVADACARGLKTALLSDTYLSAAQVSSLLRDIGIAPELFDVILTSSTERVSKREGGLFAKLLDMWPGVPAACIVHLGDHAHADVTMSARAGLAVGRHDTGEDATRDHLRLETLRHGAPSPELVSLRRLACSDARPMVEDRAWWFSLGASILGPLTAAFADWVVTECERDALRTVRPLMREGALFAPLIANAAASAGIDLDVRALFVSRSSTWLASLDTFGESEIRALLQRQQLNVGEALATLGLRADEAPEALRTSSAVRLGAAARTRTTSGRTVEDELTRYLSLPDVRAVVDGTAARARALLCAYLAQECRPAARVAIVDLGFKGTTGAALARATAHSGPRIHQFLTFGAEPVTRLWRQGHDVRVFAAGPVEDADLAGPIARHPAVLEALLMSGGTTIGYRTDGGAVVPVLDDALMSCEQQQAAAACQAGALAFQEHWLAWRRRHPELAGRVIASRRSLVAPLHRLLTMPTPEEASRLGRLFHEDNDGGRSCRPVVDGSRLSAYTTAEAFLAAALETAPAFDQAWLWPAGACELRWPGVIERQWRLVAGAPDGAPGAIPALALRARQAGVRQLVVWGAGEAGSALVRACRAAGVDVAGVTDSNSALWGSSIEGVQVVSPAEARTRGPHAYAIGSLAFAAEIEDALRREYEAASDVLQVFSPAVEAAA
jgi:FMN phosphatase YigB (HAD superfamily)